MSTLTWSTPSPLPPLLIWFQASHTCLFEITWDFVFVDDSTNHPFASCKRFRRPSREPLRFSCLSASVNTTTSSSATNNPVSTFGLTDSAACTFSIIMGHWLPLFRCKACPKFLPPLCRERHAPVYPDTSHACPEVYRLTSVFSAIVFSRHLISGLLAFSSLGRT